MTVVRKGIHVSSFLCSTRQRILFVCLFLMGFYAVATVFQSYNDGQLAYPHCTWTGLAFLSGLPELSRFRISTPFMHSENDVQMVQLKCEKVHALI